MFANQNSAGKLRQQYTLGKLVTQFELNGENSRSA